MTTARDDIASILCKAGGPECDCDCGFSPCVYYKAADGLLANESVRLELAALLDVTRPAIGGKGMSDNAPDWPPRGSASDYLEGAQQHGSTGQLWEVRSGQWVRMVAITRASHEALMAAAKGLLMFYKPPRSYTSDCLCANCVAHRAIAALRAANILEGK